MNRRLVSLCLVLLASCSIGTRQSPSLFDALGGMAGIEMLVAAVVDEAHADPRFGDLFEQADRQRLREQLAIQICELADGPCRYEGLDMVAAHSGMRISRAEFNWFVEDTQIAMDRVGLAWPTQNRLLARLAALQPQIIEEGPPPDMAPEDSDPLGLGK
jgi:hemoglobin